MDNIHTINTNKKLKRFLIYFGINQKYLNFLIFIFQVQISDRFDIMISIDNMKYFQEYRNHTTI